MDCGSASASEWRCTQHTTVHIVRRTHRTREYAWLVARAQHRYCVLLHFLYYYLYLINMQTGEESNNCVDWRCVCDVFGVERCNKRGSRHTHRPPSYDERGTFFVCLRRSTSPPNRAKRTQQFTWAHTESMKNIFIWQIRHRRLTHRDNRTSHTELIKIVFESELLLGPRPRAATALFIVRWIEFMRYPVPDQFEIIIIFTRDWLTCAGPCEREWHGPAHNYSRCIKFIIK